jgi:hypothetical protein
MRRALAIVGGLVALVGAVWALQGLNVIGGSRMTGDPFWAVVGVACVLVGLLVVYLSVRTRAGSARQ